MLELHLVAKYLRLSRRSLSSGLIALASTLVIALVVALLLAFFSITRQMESRWLEKITALSAPVRITPTENYRNSYYYNADSAAESSNFTLLSLGEKANQEKADPLNLEIDDLSSIAHLPKSLDSKGQLRHLARELKEAIGDIDYREMSVAGGGMRLRLLRDQGAARMQSLISAVPYFFGVDATEPKLGELIVEPTSEDFDNLVRSLLSSADPVRIDDPQTDPRAERAQVEKRLMEFLQSVNVTALKTGELPWRLPSYLLPQQGKVRVWQNPQGSFYLTPLEGVAPTDAIFSKEGIKIDERFYERKYAPLIVGSHVHLPVKIGAIKGEQWAVELSIGSLKVTGFVPVDMLHIADAKPTQTSPLFASVNKGALQMPCANSMGEPILLPKSFREKGTRLGDLGYLSYQASGLSGSSEQRITSYVAGFYDPGLSPLASRIILVPRKTVLAISSEGVQYDFDQTLGGGFLLWGKDIGETPKLKAEIARRLKAANLEDFFRIEAFTDYEFTRPFLQQFRSDRQLFTLISGLVLLVACCNVFSFLVLLVNDKRADIAILRTMGASKASIARIFCLAALTIGLSATLIGTLFAALFLYKLPALLNMLSFLQNHPAFSPDIFGVSHALTIDPFTLLYTWIGVPLLSLGAGAIAARKAASLSPTEVLKS